MVNLCCQLASVYNHHGNRCFSMSVKETGLTGVGRSIQNLGILYHGRKS